jgi:hypothetical protein
MKVAAPLGLLLLCAAPGAAQTIYAPTTFIPVAGAAYLAAGHIDWRCCRDQWMRDDPGASGARPDIVGSSSGSACGPICA